jgi:cation:H+ antiporter
MIFDLILFAIGLILVLKGGDYFVDSSITIATRLNIPRIVVGGTIVSLATTLPELVVSTTASYMGDTGIALGNAVGSAIANIGLIVSISAILLPISIDVIDFRRRALWMLFSAVLVFLFALDLEISRLSGLILFGVGILYLLANSLRTIFERKKERATSETPSSKDSNISLGKAITIFLLGAVFVIVGSKLLVDSSIKIAEALHVPSLIIGLTAVAIGTSLPELVTAIKSAKKKAADLALGNIIGANILNLAFITGCAAMIRPLSLDGFTRFARFYAFSWLFIMIIGMMFIFWKKGEMTKKAGIVMLTLYVIFNLGLIFFVKSS